MKNKLIKNLLIVDHARSFSTNFSSYLADLSKDFNIVLLLETKSSVDYPKNLLLQVKNFKKQCIINDYFTTPGVDKGIFLHLFFRKHSKHLRQFKFDYCLSVNECSLIMKYIKSEVISKNCKRIVFWPTISYMFMYNQKLSKKLLNNKTIDTEEFEKLDNYISRKKFFYGLNQKNFKIYFSKGIFFFIIKSISKFKSLLQKIKKTFSFYLNYKLIPFFLIRKTFSISTLEQITQIGNGKADAYFFTDINEVKVHKNLFNNQNIFLVRSPSDNQCKCNDIKNINNNKLLCPLSGWEDKIELETEVLNLFVRDISTVLQNAKLNTVVLRNHPDFTNKNGWSNQLSNELENKGYKCELQDCSISITELACKYKFIAGFASTSLRDLRNSCQKLKIIGFKSVSKYYFDDPQFTFGASLGIDWIEEDGTFKKEIFNKDVNFQIDRKNIIESINEFMVDKPS